VIREWGWLRIVLFAGFLATGGGVLAQEAPGPPPPGNSQAQQTGQDQTPQNQTPDRPKPTDEKRSGSANTAQGAPEQQKDFPEEAAEATKKLGEQALVAARDWERGWFVGVYVEKGRVLVPMTARQRREIYLQQTLATPGAYLKRMFDAGIDQWRESPLQWGDGWTAYGERFASREGQFIAANSLAALGNAALHYEPRYDQCRCSGFWPRTRHAIVRNFLTYDRSEQELRPQWGLYGGAFGGGMIATAWKPHSRNAFAEGGIAMAEQAGFGAALNFFIEFSTEINRKIWVRRK
jgi:hypothetical protein